MVVLIDNFDSFSYNLYDYIAQLGLDCQVYRNNKISLKDLKKMKDLEAIVISPGPGIPSDYSILDEVLHYFHKTIPILGICLGHQAIGIFFGAQLVKAKQPMHGKTSQLDFQKHYLFKNIVNSFDVMRYHSLVLEQLPPDLEIIATTKDKTVMAISHKNFPLIGIQFHPESILTDNGLLLLKNFFEYHLR